MNKLQLAINEKQIIFNDIEYDTKIEITKKEVEKEDEENQNVIEFYYDPQDGDMTHSIDISMEDAKDLIEFLLKMI